MLVGKLRFTPREAGEFTLREAANAIEGYTESENLQFRTDWERTRMLAWLILSGWGVKKKGGGEITPQELLPLTWDKEQPTKKVKPLTEEEKAELTKKLGL